MKRELFLFLCLFSTFSMSALAQAPQLEYRPFAQDGKTWEMQVGLINENIYGICIEGDTLIDGEIWKKGYTYRGFPDFGLSYYVALRDVGSKVYAVAKGSSRPRLLYDFSLKEGNTVKCGIEGNAFACLLDKGEKPDTLLGFPFESYLKVERIDTITYQEQVFRRLTLTFLDAFLEPLRNGENAMFGNVVWIEGVGAGAGPFTPWVQLPANNTILQVCKLNKEYLCTDFYGSYQPSLIGEVVRREWTNDITYDLQGWKVSRSSKVTGAQGNEQLPCGVYIRDGKKFVVK